MLLSPTLRVGKSVTVCTRFERGPRCEGPNRAGVSLALVSRRTQTSLISTQHASRRKRGGSERPTQTPISLRHLFAQTVGDAQVPAKHKSATLNSDAARCHNLLILFACLLSFRYVIVVLANPKTLSTPDGRKKLAPPTTSRSDSEIVRDLPAYAHLVLDIVQIQRQPWTQHPARRHRVREAGEGRSLQVYTIASLVTEGYC